MLEIKMSMPDGLADIRYETASDVGTGAWFNLVKPTAAELRIASELTGAGLGILRAALDQEESSRIEFDVDDDRILIITNIPKKDETLPFGYDTIPLGIIISDKHFITVCLEETDVLSDFDAEHHRYFDTCKRTRFLFQILYRTVVLYLKDIRILNRVTDDIEMALRRSMKNKELFLLLDMQKAMTYFTVSLRSNRSVIERLLRIFGNKSAHHIVKLREEDEDLLEDVRIEYDQAIEMVQVHSDVLSSSMDAFASVISNNLNIVMKFLAAVTILMAIPTMIASFFGMNVPIPWQGYENGFILVMIVSVVLTIIASLALWMKKMF
ncbi:magnesium transporter [Synergistales bacterium]|nr:magnesium transporter [Synergistales bacterium]